MMRKGERAIPGSSTGVHVVDVAEDYRGRSRCVAAVAHGIMRMNGGPVVGGDAMPPRTG
jgi:hypothetical protein